MKRRTFIKTAAGGALAAEQGLAPKRFDRGGDPTFESFQSPGREYSLVPLWWWDGDRLDKERLTWQLEELKRGGILSVCFIAKYPDGPPMGAQVPYFSPGWWDFMEHAGREIKRLGMTLWVHDESYCRPVKGFWQLRIQEEAKNHPAYRGHQFACVRQAVAGPARVRLQWPEGMEVLQLAAYPVDADGRIRLSAARPLRPGGGASSEEQDLPAGRWLVLAIGYVQKGLDYATRAVVDRYLDLHHEEYRRRWGRLDQSVLTGIFQDELYILRGVMSGPVLLERFRKSKGYDPVPLLPGLVADIGPQTDRIRCDYYDVMTQLIEENWFRPVFEWSEKNGIIMSFDNWGRRSFADQATNYGDYYRAMRWYQVPGYDDGGPGDIGERNFLNAKLSSSIAAFYERKRVWCEAFHTTGWGLSPERQMAMAAENFCYGANLYDKHGLYYSTLGGWYEQAPPDTHFRQPYWKHAAAFSEAITRMSYLFSQGVPVVDVALLYPAATMHAQWQADAGITPLGQAISRRHVELARNLYDAGCDLLFIDPPSLLRAGFGNGQLSVGKLRFPVLLIGPATTLYGSTLAAARKLFDAGGVVVFADRLPEATAEAGGEDPYLRETLAHILGSGYPPAPTGPLLHRGAAGGAGLFFVGGGAELARLLRDLIRPDILTDVPGILHAHRRLENQDSYLFLNTSDQPRTVNIRLRGRGLIEEWNPRDGSRSAPAGVRQEGDYATIAVDFEPFQHRILVLHGGPQRAGSSIVARTRVQQLALNGTWQFRPQPSLDNRWGDFRYPPGHYLLPPEVRRFQYRPEGREEDGVASGWAAPGIDWAGWTTEDWSYGPQCWMTGDLSLRGAPPSGRGTRGWELYRFSRRIGKPGTHPDDHGFNAEVGPNFLQFPAREGGSLCWTTVRAERDGPVEFLCGPGIDRAWVNGEPVEAASGVLCTLRRGANEVMVQAKSGARTYWSMGQPGRRATAFDMKYIPRLRWFHEEAGLDWDPWPWDEKRVGWYRFPLPVGAKEFSLPVIGEARVWVDGEAAELSSGRVVLRRASPEARVVLVRLQQKPGCYGGAAFSGPVAVVCEPVEVALEDWSKYGLGDFSGLGIYRQKVTLSEIPAGSRVELDLGQVHVSAAVRVNDQEIGRRLARPFRFDITSAVKPGANTIEIEVANTVASHFRSEAPTRYVYPGQDQAGMAGPVRIEIFR